MSSLVTLRRNGGTSYRIRWYLNNKRGSLYLPHHYTLSQAKTACHYIDRLVDAATANHNIDGPTLAWLADVGPEMQRKLADAGLIDLAPDLSIKELFQRFDNEYPAAQKLSTWRTYRTVYKRLISTFDPEMKASQITEKQALNWRQALTEVYAEATVAGTVQRLRTVWGWAVCEKYLDKNVFLKIPRGSFVNKNREFFVSMDFYNRLLAVCPDQTWRTILALCRIGGLRCPSEVLQLKWEDVAWDAGRLCIYSPKTAHLPGHDYRIIPLFPALREELDRQFQNAAPVRDGGSIYVIDRWRDSEINLRTNFERIIFRAGLPTWPRLFHNLRGSRSNELFSEFPCHVAAEWMGQSAAVALQHYLHASDADFDRALAEPVEPVPADGEKISPKNFGVGLKVGLQRWESKGI